MLYSNIAELLSLIAAMVYYYNKTKNKAILWVLGNVLFFAICVFLFKKLYPDIPFVSPTPEYMCFLAIVGVPFLITIVMIFVETEKQKPRASEEYDRNSSAIFTPTRGNIIFWTIIVLINLAGFIADGRK